MFTLQSDVGQAILLPERLRNLNCFYLVPQLSLISLILKDEEAERNENSE